jgi:ribosomal protein L32
MTAVVLWFTLALAVGLWAGNRGRGSGTWFLIALVISPLLAAIFLGVSTNLAAAQLVAGAVPSDSTHARCPACKEYVLPEANVCKHCGAALTPDHTYKERAAGRAQAATRQQSARAVIFVGILIVVIAWAFLSQR